MITISLFPLSIHADTIDSHITGRNIWYEPIQSQQNNNYALNIGKFVVEIILDGDYIGYMLPNYTIQYRNYYYGASPASWGTTQKQYQNRIFVNGSVARFEVPLTWYSLVSGNAVSVDGTTLASPYVYDSYTITSSDVTAYDQIQSLNQIIEILQDNNDIVGDIYNELLTVVSNTNLANQYLETISKLRQWDFPFESFPFNVYLLTNNFVVNDIINFNFWKYPIFEINKNDYIYTFNASNNNIYRFILFIDKNIYTSRIPEQFSFSSGSMINYGTLQSFRYGNSPGYILYIDFQNNTGSNINPSLIYKDNLNTNKANIICFYSGLKDNKNISTDFALLFGLSNNLLDNLNVIANGTSSSSSSSNDLDDTTSQFQTDANSLISIEDSFNSTMNSNLDNINPTFNMGSSFLASANWVSTQFNRIVNNTPFSSLITFGLTLGLGLLIIGKIRK